MRRILFVLAFALAMLAPRPAVASRSSLTHGHTCSRPSWTISMESGK